MMIYPKMENYKYLKTGTDDKDVLASLNLAKIIYWCTITLFGNAS